MLKIGCGAGFSSDRLEPAVDLAEHAGLDYLVFECVGERTLAFGHRDRMRDPAKGYNSLLERRLRAVLSVARRNGVRIVTNMGAANPRAAAEAALGIARALGLEGLRIACVEGDEVTALMTPETTLWETGGTIADVGLKLVGANAYLGIDALLPALEAGADVVIAGRVADPSLFLAPIVHHHGWARDDWPRLGAGTLVGHLLECGMQITGGYFADPPLKTVPGLARCGFPYAEVAPDGSATITKLASSGGAVTVQTVKEQMLYEVHDPARYLTPDVTASFAGVAISEPGRDRVALSGATGTERPAQLKVTVGFDGGVLAEAGVSYAGPNAQGRARLARDIIAERMTALHGFTGALRLDLIGVNSLHGSALERATDTEDVRLRAALRSTRRDDAELLLWEVEALLCCGPAGGGGFRGQITPSVVTHSASLDRARVATSLTVLEA
jgi:Acyclic terpene utilisation family protein AtuA